MRYAIAAALSVTCLTAVASAQEPAPVYQQQQAGNLRFSVDGLLRQEWTRDVFVSASQTRSEERRRLRLLPRVELGGDRFTLGVGVDVNYSTDTNVPSAVSVVTQQGLIRDNYDSRDFRLDLAFARVEPVAWLRLEGGRFEMPVGLTEMIWDRDLRPQGAALTLQHKDDAGRVRASVSGLFARGSHVFDDDASDMFLGSAQVTLPGAGETSLQLVGSYLEFRHADALEPMIRRQNSRVAGVIVGAYRVVDLVARIRTGSPTLPLQLVGDYCWNTALDSGNRGVWLAAVLGSLEASRGRAEYTYAKVDKDATLAAYGTDDFFWVTGWEGHRGELATRLSSISSLHLIGQLQRFKDSPRPEERDHWVKRYRIEIRLTRRR